MNGSRVPETTVWRQHTHCDLSVETCAYPLSAVPFVSFFFSQLLLRVRLDDRDEPSLVCLVCPDLPGLAQVLHKVCEGVPLGGVHVDVVPAGSDKAVGACAG